MAEPAARIQPPGSFADNSGLTTSGAAMERRSTPSLDQVAMVCLLLAADGRIRWSNKAATALGSGIDQKPATFAELVADTEYLTVSDLLDEAHLHGRAAGTVRLVPTASRPKPRYLQVVITRAGARRAEPLGPNEVTSMLGGLMVQGWDVTSLMLEIQDLQVHASSDYLTGLANRLTFTSRLNEEIARSQRSGRNIAVTIVSRLRAAASVTARLGEHRISVSLSIGLAFAIDTDQQDGGTRLLGRADAAMYKDKQVRGQAGRGERR